MRVDVVEAEDGLRVRDRGSPFSVSIVRSRSDEVVDAERGVEEDQAIEKGWDVQRPRAGMVRKRCWPG